MTVADIASGEVDTADILFLGAVILFVIYALVAYAGMIDARIHNVILGLGFAATALAFLLL